MQGINTRILHQPAEKEDVYHAIRFPVYDTAAYAFETSEDIANAFQGKEKAHQYTRGSNPTVEHFERMMKSVTGAHAAVAVASGMAAITNICMALCRTGDNLVVSRFLFGNSYSLFNSTLPALGINIRFANMESEQELNSLIDENTRGVFCETITNPQLQVVDISSLADFCHSRKIPLIVDTTLTPPGMFQGKLAGVDVEVMSATKYFSGGGTGIGGCILDHGTYFWSQNPTLEGLYEKTGANALLARLKKEIFRNFGACLSPHNAFLLTLGMETLTMRVEKTCNNALGLAQWLQTQKLVKAISYPGLPSHPNRAVAEKQFNGLYGGLLTFDLESSEKCFQVMDGLQIIKRATNLNDNRSLIIHPESTIYCEFSDKQKSEQGIRDTSIRLSAGIEDLPDLISDLEQALNG